MPKKKPRRSIIGAKPRRATGQRRKSYAFTNQPENDSDDDSDSQSDQMDVECGTDFFHEEHEFTHFIPPDADAENIEDLEDCLMRVKTKTNDAQAHVICEAFQQISSSIEKHVNDLIFEQHSLVYKQVSKFCQQSWAKGGVVRELKDATFGRARVPTACVLLGGSSAHASLLYDQLTQSLSEISPLVARIEVDLSAKTLKSNHVLNQIVSSIFEVAIEFCTDDGTSVSNKGRKQRKMTSPEELREQAIAKAGIPARWDRRPMSVLSSWYKQDFLEKKGPMVLVLEGLNTWSTTVVQKLFMELHNLVKEDVPVIVVTGMTSLQTLVDKLDYKTKRLIFARDFRLAPANKVLDKIIEEVLYAPWWPFHMTTEIVQMILTNFKTNFYSTAKFIESLNLLLTSHFANEPLARLSVMQLPDADVDEILDSITTQDLKVIARLDSVPSVQTPRKQALNQIRDWSVQWKKIKLQHKPAFDVLWKFCSSNKLPRIEKMELYFDLQQNKPQESQVLRQFWKKLQSKSDVNNQCRNILHAWSNALTSDKRYAAYVKKTKAFAQENEKLVQQRKSKMTGLSRHLTPKQSKRTTSRLDQLLKTAPQPSPIQKRSKLRRNEFRKNIMNKERPSKDLLRRIQSMIYSYIIEFLPPLHCLPLYEVYSLKDVATLREALEAQPSYVFSDLEHPPFENDISSLFEFWHETDRVINVAEWMKRFIGDQSKDFLDRQTSEEEKQQMSCRFRRALNDFKVLGLIDDSCSRKGHVKQCKLQYYILQKLFNEDADDRRHKREATVG